LTIPLTRTASLKRANPVWGQPVTSPSCPPPTERTPQYERLVNVRSALDQRRQEIQLRAGFCHGFFS